MKILKSSDKVFAFRKRIMKLLYEARDVRGTDLPRIKVRVVDMEKERNVIGKCFIKKDFIVISDRCVADSENELRWIVWHELGHAYFDAKHDDKCPLMSPHRTKATKSELVKAFKNLTKE